jgi:arsenate reductase-like glutaredoxin family protein
MPVTMYHNPRCNTSRRTRALLREKSVAGIKALLLSKRQSVAGIRLVLEGLSRRKDARLNN